MAVSTTYRWLRLVRATIGLLMVTAGIQHFYTLYQPNTLAAKLPLASAFESPPDSKVLGVNRTEALLAEVRDTSRAVFENSEHCEVSDLRLSWLENTILALNPFSNLFQQGILVRDRFRCGYCHQRSFLLLEMLQERFDRSGASAQMQGLNGHVVLQFEVDGRSFLTDPDYGVGPFEYHTEDDALTREVNKAYAGVSNLNQLLSMYLSRSDNLAYSSTESFNTIKSKQLRWFQFSNIVGAILTAFGFILLWLAVRK